MNESFDSIVIGGGQAGLAAGYYLKQNGLHFLILEAGSQAGGSWSRYYNSLKLFSPARFSSLPGMGFPAGKDHYPHRNEVIHYLEHYQNKFHLPVKFEQRVQSVIKDEKGFVVHSTTGDTYRTKTIISATGSFHNPYKPVIPGNELYQGRIMHSSEYKNPESFRNQRIVVAGRGNSAVQIAVELSEVSTTSLAVLKPVQFVNPQFLGQDIHFWIRLFGFDTFPFWRFGLHVPLSKSVIDTDGFEKRISSGNPKQQQMFQSFYENGVIWPNGDKEKVDSVIFATGYRPSLSFLEQIGALDPDGMPIHLAGVSKVPGLYFVGLEGQRSFASATLRGVGPDAKFVVKRLVRFLKTLTHEDDR